MSADRKPQTHYDYVDGLRAIAVLMVVFFHVVDSEATAQGRILPGIDRVGAHGVDLFFVVSGLCLALPFFQKMNETGFLTIDYGRFMIRRFARIAPPYYIALILFSLLALTPFKYPSTFSTSSEVNWAGVHEFLPDLAFMTTREPVANASFWTLGIEMRWYAVCPLLIALFVRSRVAFALVMLGAYATFYVPREHVLDAGTLPAFMLGIFAAHIALNRPRVEAWFSALAVGLIFVAIVDEAVSSVDNFASPLWHFALFALVIAAGTKATARILSAKPLVFIGRASFSVYLVHLPLIVWLGRHGCPWPVAGAIATAAGLGFWAVVERSFLNPQMRARIESGIANFFRRYRRAPIVIATSNSWSYRTAKTSRVSTAADSGVPR